jgi:hypothetical protein
MRGNRKHDWWTAIYIGSVLGKHLASAAVQKHWGFILYMLENVLRNTYYVFNKVYVHLWLCPMSRVTIANLDLLSNSETGVNPGIRSWKKHLSDWARCQEAIGGIYFTKKWRAETIQPGLEFDNFKPWLNSGIFKCISWLNVSFLGGDNRSFPKEEVETYQIAPMSHLNSPTLSVSSHL